MEQEMLVKKTNLNHFSTRSNQKYCFIFLLLFLNYTNLFSLENGLARTPPMGWNGWNTFRCEGITESLYKQMTDQMVSKGLKAAGYQYMNIDDCWSAGRDSAGFLKATTDFTNQSIKTLSDYIHSKGLKIGIHGSAGTGTCESRSGSFGFEEKDAQRYAEWEIDYVKQDYCWTPNGCGWAGCFPKSNLHLYVKFRDELLKTKRPILYSICSWGKLKEHEWADTVGNMWRTTNDIELGFSRIKSIITQQENLWPYSKPGAWNDPDMLMVGNGMTKEHDQVHFGMWAMLAAPLILGNDLRTMSNQTLQIITNLEAIAINQDSLGIQAKVMKLHTTTPAGKAQIWVRPLVNGRAIAFYNSTKESQKMSFSLTELNTEAWSKKGLTWDQSMSGKLNEVWTKKDEGIYNGGVFTADVPPESMLLYTLKSEDINWNSKIPPNLGGITKISQNRFYSAGGMKLIFLSPSKLRITLPFEDSNYKIINSLGKELYSGKILQYSKDISLVNFPNGIYNLVVYKGKSKFTRSFSRYL